ncbi:MAG: hypothetical protein WCY78_07555 [Sphaerochaetaceae bacterium]
MANGEFFKLSTYFNDLGLSWPIVFVEKRIPRYYEGFQWKHFVEGSHCSVHAFRLPFWEVWFLDDNGRKRYYIMCCEEPPFPYHEILEAPLPSYLHPFKEVVKRCWYVREERQMLCWGIKKNLLNL